MKMKVRKSKGSPPYFKQIERIMREFNFEYVQEVMGALYWGWFYTMIPPSIEQLQKCAKRHLLSVAREDCNASRSGGFMARNDNGYLTLSFVIEEKAGFDYL